MVNLIEYSDNPKTSPLHILSDFIDEFEPPVAIVKINEEGKNYTYPIERLRKFAVFSDVINQKARRQLMQLVQPRPNKRYNMTNIFTEDVLCSINFDPISLNVDEFVSSNNKEFKFGTSEPVELLLYNDKMFQNPAIEIESEKPYDYNIRKFSNINVVFIKYGTFQDELQLISSFIDIILNGYDEDISIPSLKSYVSL